MSELFHQGHQRTTWQVPDRSTDGRTSSLTSDSVVMAAVRCGHKITRVHFTAHKQAANETRTMRAAPSPITVSIGVNCPTLWTVRFQRVHFHEQLRLWPQTSNIIVLKTLRAFTQTPALSTTRFTKGLNLHVPSLRGLHFRKLLRKHPASGWKLRETSLCLLMFEKWCQKLGILQGYW